ncbi:uncharacterized protein MELLADRAFT_104899 [Melampsora larici-populina 98AG31]|uniref:Uncharacterized protein n=1 Tax=Melampsora larici-populina (strain 98AG31 / pathotype 3-4-7) TaxID=747676 RepID=F4RGG1_MELLP|nr:uncharacterized protein MELLADRAFT_104899 [Melampsora larici-populina 98AG31]EGG08655.1 hypothetical protein MELLADRAFT_104899 [Melampsora larici-populina 98AG31]
MLPSPSSLLAPLPSNPPPTTGPTLRPRTPTQPRPGFIAQSPDLRVATLRPSPIRHTISSDTEEPSVYELSGDQSDTTDGSKAASEGGPQAMRRPFSDYFLGNRPRDSICMVPRQPGS